MRSAGDLTGKIYGKWTVLSACSSAGTNKRWTCICECGAKKVVHQRHLISGASGSCGSCGARKKKGKWKGGHPLKSEYRIWSGMKERCLNPHNKSYHNYGGRGISVCPEWLSSFERFFLDVGEKPTPSYTLERIDNNGNYEPVNCRWATRKEQSENRRGNIHVIVDGSRMTLREASRRLGISQGRARTAYNKGLIIAAR